MPPADSSQRSHLPTVQSQEPLSQPEETQEEARRIGSPPAPSAAVGFIKGNCFVTLIKHQPRSPPAAAQILYIKKQKQKKTRLQHVSPLTQYIGLKQVAVKTLPFLSTLAGLYM